MFFSEIANYLVYVIGWSTVVFGINSASNAVRKCEIVRGEAECYFTLPDCIASAINPNTTVWTILLQINPTSTMSLIGTEHSIYAAFTQEPNDRRTVAIVAAIDRRGHGCWVRVQ